MAKSQQREPLTPKRIAELPLPKAGKRLIAWDAGEPGAVGTLGLRYNADGIGSFVLNARFPMRKVDGQWRPNLDKMGTLREIAPLVGFQIGTDKLTLPMTRALREQIAETRQTASAWRKAIKAGRDPGHEEEQADIANAKRIEAEAAAAAAVKTVDDLVAAYSADAKRRKLRSARAVEQQLRRELLGQKPGDKDSDWIDASPRRWRGKPVIEVTEADAAELVLAVLADGDEPEPGRRRNRGGASAARKTLVHGKILWTWGTAVGRKFGLSGSPFARLRVKDLIGRAKPRQRVLTDGEIRLAWRATGKDVSAFGDLPRFLLLTAVRLNEAARARASEFDLGKAEWLVPAERMKSGKAHLVPLSPAAVELVRKRLRESTHRNGYLFSTTAGAKPVSGFSRAKARLDRIIADLRREDAGGAEVEPLPAWGYHDLRRSARSRFSTIPVSDDIVRELALAHVPTGVRATYDVHDYLDEKRALLDSWAKKLSAIVEPPPDNVVTLSEAKAR